MATTTTEENKELLRRAIRAWNERDRDGFAECHAEDVVFHGTSKEIHGRDEVIAHQWSFFDSFSDNTITVHDVIAEDDRVALRYTTSGTHDGTFEGIEPTGETVHMAQMAMVRVDDGEIAEKWVQGDVYGLIHQLDGEPSTATPAKTIDQSTHLDESALESFSDHMRGDVLLPGDDGYDEARTVWNGLFDKYPALVAQCAGVADVITSVNFAWENELLLSVKSGGHDYAGNSVCDEGMVIDLSSMDAVRVDPDVKTARVGPGASWGDVYHETQAFGLATTGGAGIVGVAGFTLGGGISYLARKHGLTCDNLIGADVVTADGRLVHASEDEHEELFWGLRGGSGNFGIVTSFEYRLHEVGPEVLAGNIVYPYEDARNVLEFYRNFMAGAPDELGCFVIFLRVPPEPPFPEEYHGEPAIGLGVCYAGPAEEGKDVIEPLREFGDPMLDGVTSQPYLDFKRSNDELYRTIDRWYSKSHYLAGLPDEAIDVVLDYTEEFLGPYTMVGIIATGGAINRVDRTATAFPHRDAAFEFDIWPGWTDPGDDEALIEWATEFHEAMAPFSTGGVYVNMLSHDEEDRIRAAYGDNYDRLVELKNTWDPENLFRMNQNIEPTSED